MRFVLANQEHCSHVGFIVRDKLGHVAIQSNVLGQLILSKVNHEEVRTH